MFRMTQKEYSEVHLKKVCPNCGHTELGPDEIDDCFCCNGNNECEFNNSEGYGCFILTCLDCGHQINRPFKETDEKCN